MESHTFVIPAYKDSPYLDECVKSLKNQKSKSNVLITTSTPSEYIKNISNKHEVEVVVNNETKGLANDWNFAYSQAKTKFVTIAHQDDIYESNYFETISAVLKKQNNKKTLIIFTDYHDLVENKIRNISINSIVKKILLTPFIIKSNIKYKFLKKLILIFGDPICCPAVTFNKEELFDFSFSTEFKVNPDWYAWLQFAQQEGTFVYINKKLMKHRIHADSETLRQIKTNARKQEELKMFEIMWGKCIGRVISFIYSLSHKDNIM